MQNHCMATSRSSSAASFALWKEMTSERSMLQRWSLSIRTTGITGQVKSEIGQGLLVLLGIVKGPVQQAMDDAGLKPSDLSRVLLVGGSTRIPAVQDAVRALTGREPSRDINPDECVAMGACLQGGVLTGTINSIVLIDVTPLSKRKFPAVCRKRKFYHLLSS